MSRDLPQVSCDPPGVATGMRLIESNTDPEGTTIPLSVVLEIGSVRSPYRFDHVSFVVGGESRSSGLVLGNSSDLKDDDGNWTLSNVVAHFKIPTIEVIYNTEVSPEKSGSVTPESKRLVVVAGSRYNVSFTATPVAGYKLLSWQLDGHTLSDRSTVLTLTRYAGSVDEQHTLTAVFSLRNPSDPPAPDAPYDPNGPDPTDPTEGPKYSYIVVYTNCDPDGVATTTPDGITYVGYPDSAVVVTCRATKNSPAGDAYEFHKWTGTAPIGTQSGSTMRTVLTFPPVAGTFYVVQFTANYRELGKYKITTAAIPEDGGTTLGDGYYASGESCTVDAVAANSKFLKWKNAGGNVVSRDTAYSFTVTGDTDLTAVFHKWTELIVRSATSGQILHSASGAILRDE